MPICLPKTYSVHCGSSGEQVSGPFAGHGVPGWPQHSAVVPWSHAQPLAPCAPAEGGVHAARASRAAEAAVAGIIMS